MTKLSNDEWMKIFEEKDEHPELTISKFCKTKGLAAKSFYRKRELLMPKKVKRHQKVQPHQISVVEVIPEPVSNVTLTINHVEVTVSESNLPAVIKAIASL
ncbi:MAG: hypothetical protein HUJ97_08815 [Bacteroidales bacterium]|nr:hypothetical protein [Bacteroidales bacterium]